MAVKNSTLLAKVYLNGTNDYQQNMPDPTQTRISATFRKIFQPNNGRYFNDFMDNFINLIGEQKIHSKEWRNPLERFIENNDLYGSTIQESILYWIKGHVYADDAEDLLKLERPEASVIYHALNFQQKYPISVVRPEIQMAFRDPYGLNRIANAITTAPLNSARLDTFNAQVQLIAEYYHEWGFATHTLSAAPTDEETGKELLTALRAYAEKLYIPTSLYNADIVDVPVFAEPGELVWITTADYAASIDVQTLSGVFQLDKAEDNYTRIVLPELPIPNAVGILTTQDFFVCRKFVDEMGSFYDPNTLATKYIYHLWQTLSVSPYVPAILFTTDPSEEIPTVTQEVTGLTLTAEPATVEIGGTTQILADLQGTITPPTEGIKVAPDACTWEVAGTRSEAGIALNARTRVDAFGVLHAQKTGLQAGDILTVTGKSTYINPSGETTDYTATVNVTVSAPATRARSLPTPNAAEGVDPDIKTEKAEAAKAEAAKAEAAKAEADKNKK